MSEYRSVLERASASAPSPDLPLERVLLRRDRKRRDQRIRAGIVGIGVAIAVGWMGIHAIRSTPQVPADDRSEELGIFAPVAGRILYENAGVDRGYDPGFWAVDPNGPSDTTDGPIVAGDVASTLVPLELDGEPLGWSSDGTELLLVRSVGDDLLPEQYLSILHTDGTETRLNENPMGISGATISPDGTRVLFAGQYDLSGLYVIDAQGGQPVLLPIPQAGEGASDPTFSPDGTQIAYLAGNRDAEVWVANADGTGAHEILADEPTVSRDITGLEWSPAGDRLAIGLGTHERSGGSIYTFAPDGSDFTEVIVGGSSPYWSPDGSQIAYTIQCDVQPDVRCPEGSILRDAYDPQPGEPPAGLAIADPDGSNVRAFGFAASGPWHPAGSAPAPAAEALPYEFLDGEVTFAAAPQWDHSFAGWDHLPGGMGITGPSTMDTLLLGANYDERAVLVADPSPVETGCEEGPAPVDAEALARSIRSDQDLEATEPVPVSVGGIEGLRMDVVAVPGASVCEVEGSPQVMTPPGLDDGSRHFAVEIPAGHRMRLYLLDLPGGSARILAIAISAPERRFEQVVEAAASIVDSFEFHTG